MASRISKTWLRVTLVIAVLALAGGSLSCGSSTPLESIQQSDKAPDFTLPTMKGAEITLSELEGTPVVLIFWSTSCLYCNQELHRLEAVAQQNEGRLNVLAVDIGESISRLTTFFEGYEPTMIVALDETGEIFQDYSSMYNPRGFTPFTLFIDSEGVIKYVKLGAFASDTELRDSLRSIF